MKTYSGFTSDTAKSLQLDTGAFFANYDIETDTYETAVAAGKLLGATQGGGGFDAVPTVRQTEVDGVKGKAKGLENIDFWDVSLKANIVEITETTLAKALVAADIDTTTNDDYDIISARNNIELSDYIDNITWVGTLSGSNKPIIIQVYNALNTDGIKLTMKDKAEGVIPTTFYGHYTQTNLNKPPFDIYYPKAPAANES